jgi:hypothetical protein
MQAGFIVTAGGLLPQLLALFEMSHAAVWRESSVIMAIPVFLFVTTTPGRRRAATNEPIPFYEMLFAHLKRFLRLGRLRLRGPSGARFEFTLAAIAQNLRRLAKLVARPPPIVLTGCVA